MNVPSDYLQRRKDAAAIRALSGDVAVVVTEAFFDRHPDWRARYGAMGITRGIEDAHFHISFLASALETGSQTSFSQYVKWGARMLSARGIEPGFLVENLEQIVTELASRVDTGTASAMHEQLRLAVTALRDQAEDPAGLEQTLQTVYLGAAIIGNKQAALNIAREALKDGMSITDFYCDVLQPVQYEVGRLWETNRISVAQEHVATAVTQFVIAQLYDTIKIPPHRDRKVVVTGVEGELHHIGANMLSDLLEAEGWSVHFLGTQLPHKDIVRFVTDQKADVVAISAALLPSVPKVTHLVEQIRNALGDQVRFAVGGRAFRNDEELWKATGADGFASDLRGGLDLINSLAK